ncbi:TonB-dependent receptor [bacterium]|nr:TonB-dependent receptor [candidate division CSSED10-310 bacterium]
MKTVNELFSIAIACVMVISATATASTLSGKVSWDNGDSPKGIILVLEKTDLSLKRTCTIQANGFYYFSGLTPGGYYLWFEKNEISIIALKGIRIAANTPETIDLILPSNPGSETDVTRATTIQDNRVHTVIRRSFMDRLPGSDDYFTAFSLAPGTTGTANPHIHGGAHVDNVYFVDGLDIRSPITSLISTELNPDVICEYDIQTAAFAAEYGRSIGGIIHTLTRVPSNEYHGILRLRYFESDWQDSHKQDNYYYTYDENHWEPALTVEGPILKDKLWFLLSYKYYEISETTTGLPSYESYFMNAPWKKDIHQDREFMTPYAKLIYQPGEDHKITLTYFDNLKIYHNQSYSPFFIIDTAMRTENTAPCYFLNWTWEFSQRMQLDFLTGFSNEQIHYFPESGNKNKPPFYDIYSGLAYNNADIWNEDDRERFQMRLEAAYWVPDLAGSHRFKGGFEWHDISRDSYNIIPGDASYVINLDMADPDFWKDATRTFLLNPGTSTVSGNYYAVFLQDDWSVLDNLTLNLGARFEYTTYENGAGDISVPAWRWGHFKADSYMNSDGSYKEYGDMKFTGMIAPRLGINWDIFKNGKDIVRMFWGRYYSPFDLSLPYMFQPFSVDNSASSTDFYMGPEWHDNDRNGIPDEDYFFDETSWSTHYQDEPGDWNLIDPNLDPEYTDEFVIGVEHVFNDSFSVELNYIRRETRDIIEDVGLFADDDGNIVWTYKGGVNDSFTGLDGSKQYDPRIDEDYSKHLYYVTNVDEASRDYDGIEISASYTAKYLDMMTSYTYSKAEGTVIDSSEPGSSGVAQFSFPYDTYFASQNLYGELPWSAEHYLKLSGAVHYPLTDWYELSLGIDGFWRSGFPYSKRSNPPRTYDPDDPANDSSDPDTWTGRPPYRSYACYFPEGRGTYELPSVTIWDISLQNTFKAGKWGAFTVILDIFNILDQQTVIGEVDVYTPSRPDYFGQANYWVEPRSYRLSFTYAF